MQSIQRIKFTSSRRTFSLLYRPTFLAVLVLAFLLISSLCHAADFAGSLKEVTITDTEGANSPPTAVISFTASGDTVSFDASASSDPDGTIVDYNWDFGDGNKGSGVTTDHTYDPAGQYTVTLAVIDDAGGVALSQSDVETGTVAPISIAVNFQPASAPVPEGFVVDSGRGFDSTAGYGWTQPPNSHGVRDRDKPISPDQSYDTMIHVDPSSGVWEAAVPDGTYQVTIVAGDSHFPSGVQSIQAEGVTIIDNVELTKGAEWAENTGTVQVADGRLTVTFTGSSNPARLCWIKISNQ